MLDFRIETFLCVCKHLSYTQAAKELCITQPNVTQHIKYLEQHYGQKLFNYDNKTLTLTPAGLALKNAMLNMKQDTLQLRQHMIENVSGFKELSIGATLSIGEFYLPQYLPHYLAKQKNTNFHLRINNTSKLLEALDEGKIDCAFIEGNFDKETYDYQTICLEPFICVGHSDLKKETFCHFEDLFEYPLFIREQGSGTREILENYLTHYGYTLHHFTQVSEISSPHCILDFLKKNKAISFMYKTVAMESLKNHELVQLTIPNFNIYHEFNFIWRKNSIYKQEYQTLLQEMIKGFI